MKKILTMNFNSPTIYGYGVADNSCVDECLSAIECDNDIFNRSIFDPASFDAVFKSVSLNVKRGCPESSLGLIGLIEVAVKNQFPINENHLKAYMKAKSIDPLSKYPERLKHLSSLDEQISSYLSDQRILLNDYCK